MSDFTITPAALDFIRASLRKRESIPDPVVALSEISQPLAMNREWTRAFRAGADEKTLRKLLLKHHGDHLSKLHTRLVPEVHSRHEYVDQSFVEISGVVFHFSSKQMKQMKGWTLDTGEEGLVLKDATGKIVRPKPFTTIKNISANGD